MRGLLKSICVYIEFITRTVVISIHKILKLHMRVKPCTYAPGAVPKNTLCF